MNKFNDSDIREALRRSEEKRTAVEVPDDFFDSVMGKIDAEPKTFKLWRWVAAAACIAIVAGIGSAILLTGNYTSKPDTNLIAESSETVSTETQQSVVKEPVEDTIAVPEPKVVVPKPKKKPTTKPKPAAEPQPASNPNLRMERPQYAENEPKTVTSDSVSTNIVTTQDIANTGYAENQSKNNEPYLDPALMDEFILKMAEIQGVSKIYSECSIANDTNFVESFYVIPVKKDYNVLEQIAWMAGNYSNTSPGYIFSNTDRQILFSINDEPNGMNYLWIAEQIDDSKIMIYSVHAPIDIEYESDCYQQFYDDLTFSNFNTYY